MSQVAGLSRLRYGTTMRLAMRITRWLNCPATEFVIIVNPSPSLVSDSPDDKRI
jgi:hypothetical protein